MYKSAVYSAITGFMLTSSMAHYVPSMTAEAETKLVADDGCVVVNPGTPFCYQMCQRAPRLRTCEEE